MTERQRKINLPTAVNLLWGGIIRWFSAKVLCVKRLSRSHYFK